MATPHPPSPPPGRAGLSDAQRWTIVGLVALVVLLLVAVVVLAGDGDEDEGATTTTTAPTTTTTEATTTTEPEPTTTTTFAPEVSPFDVAFPSPGSSRRFEAPAGAARSYAAEVLGFTELVLGTPTVGDDGRAEVVVQAAEDGPETVIHLIQGGDAWYVTGSDTPDVVVTQPAPGTSLATPFETAGEALAFEGTVEVLVLTQDSPDPLGRGTVTGSGTPPPGPFSGDIAYFTPPEPTAGVLVYRITSPEDGRVVQATSLRVRLTDLTADAPTS